MAETKNKRDLVKECIELGNMTKADIAEKFEMSPGSVSTQMTYLRWMGLCILTDAETKVLSFTDQATFDAIEAERKSNVKSKSTSTRSPEERSVAVDKTISNQMKQLEKWEVKLGEAEEMLETLPEDESALLAHKEAVASIALLEVKIARNEALAGTLPDVEEARDALAEEDDAEDEAATDDLL